MKYFYHMLI